MYYLPENYKSRALVNHFDNTRNTDQFQNGVYETTSHLVRICGYKSVVDIGCGSAFKLMKYFSHIETLGIDVRDTIRKIEDVYKRRHWAVSRPESFHKLTTDVVICSDVIEHVLKPDDFLRCISEITAEWFIFSTPNRDKLYGKGHKGPPRNTCHHREWNEIEFERLLSDYFDVRGYKLIDPVEATMLFQCRKLKDV